jgi:hypothetical protein
MTRTDSDRFENLDSGMLIRAWAVGKRRNPVVFVVTFTDGTTTRIGIDSTKLVRGDQAAYSVATERMQAGLLPDKQIKSIRRAHRH